jgi:hypothetical protein
MKEADLQERTSLHRTRKLKTGRNQTKCKKNGAEDKNKTPFFFPLNILTYCQLLPAPQAQAHWQPLLPVPAPTTN